MLDIYESLMVIKINEHYAIEAAKKKRNQ